MAVETAVRPQTGAGQWSSIFPSEQISEQQSALFVKKLLAVGVSTITYLRTIFPEHAFGDRCLEDLNLKILRDDSSCPGACRVIKWMKGCFDALDKKYLRALIIGLYVNSDDPDTVIESYTFKFSYSESGPNVDIYRNESKISRACSERETKKATLQLLRTIIVLTQSLKLLPDEAMMTMKLLYYDEVTPPDYEPPGFKAAPSDHFSYAEEPMNIKVGDVSTPFHTVKLRMKTDKNQFDIQEDDEGEKGENEGGKNVEEIIDKGLDEEVEVNQEKQMPEVAKSQEPENHHPGDVPVESPVLPDKSTEAGLVANLPEDVTPTEDDFPVKCPCGLAEDDGLMIKCECCESWQHAVCFKILSEAQAPAKHICYNCAEKSPDDLSPTDPYLTNLEPVNATATCLWRRTLLAATEFTRIVIPSFAKRLGVEVTVARGLLNRMEKEGFVKSAGRGRTGRLVQVKKLKSEGFSKYFQKTLPEDSSYREPMEKRQPESMEMDSNKHQHEVDSLTEKTAQMDVSTRSTRSKKNGSQKKLEITAKGDNPSNDKSKKLQMKPVKAKKQTPRSRKRASIGGNDFDVSDSQEISSQSGRKRRKASSVSKPVVV